MSGGHLHFEILDAVPQKHINELHRFTILVLGGFCGICASFSYAFNLFSGEMQSVYNLSQRNLTIISTVGLILQYVSLPYAFLFDYFGPMIIAVIGVVYISIGSVTLALCFRGQIKGSVVRLSVFNGFLMCGCIMFDMISCVTVISYFPTRKGAIVAIIKSLIGLGQAIVGSLYTAFFDKHVDYYFFFLMAVTAVAGLLAIAFLRLPAYHLTNYELAHWSDEKKHQHLKTKVQYLKQTPPPICFVYAFVIIGLLIVSLPTESAVVSYLQLTHKYKIAFAIVTIILTFAFAIVAFPISFFADKVNKGSTELSTEPIESNEQEVIDDVNGINIISNEMTSSLQHADAFTNVEINREGESKHRAEEVKNVKSVNESHKMPETEIDFIAPQYQVTFMQSLKTLELWALGWTFMNTAGLTLAIIFNSTFILGALQSSPPDTEMRALLTVLNGVGSAVGRLIMSYFEYWCHKQPVEKRVPFTLSLYFNLVTGIIAVILFLTLPAKALPLPYVLTALDNGFAAATIVLVTRTMYAKDPAKFYNFCFFAIAMSALVYNRFVYGEWYSKQAEKQNNVDKQCYGKHCVSFTFYFILGMTCSSLITATFVHLRYCKFCRLVLEERRRLREEVEEVSIVISPPMSVNENIK